MNKKSEQNLKELKAIHDKLEYIMNRQTYLVEYIAGLGKSNELTATEVIARAKELTGLEEEYNAENVKLNTLTLIIGYESQIADFTKKLAEASIDSFQDMGR